MRVLWFIVSLQDKESVQHHVLEGKVLCHVLAAPSGLLPLQCTRGQLQPHFQTSCSGMKATTSSEPVWDSGTNTRNLTSETWVRRNTLNDRRPESSQSNLLPPPFSKEQRALKLSQPSHPAQAVQCFPVLLFPSRQLQPHSPRCSAVMGSGCPSPT